MKTMTKFLILLSMIGFVTGSVYAGKRDPVAMLFQVKGKVEYSRNGKKWKKVRRNKFLLPGYQVRSLAASSGKVTLKTTGENFLLQADTLFIVTADQLLVKSGTLAGAEQSNRLVSGLIKKFSKSQSYTTVRRNAQKKKLDAVRGVVISNEHPYLVWDNIDKQAAYQLTIGEEVYEVPATSEEMVRAKINLFSGTQKYKIQALKNNEVIAELQPFKSRGVFKNHSISWLLEEEQKELQEAMTTLMADYGEDTFMLGTYFEKQKMWVAAMDQYRVYLSENIDDIEMTPYLFRVYKKLKLNTVYNKELKEWNQAMAE